MARSRLDRLRVVVFYVFHIMIGKITLFAIESIIPERMIAKQVVEETNGPDYESLLALAIARPLSNIFLPVDTFYFEHAKKEFYPFITISSSLFDQ